MNSLFFYVPFLYSLHTRLKSKMSRIAWFFTYLIPVFIIFYSVYGMDIISFILSVFSVYTLYEVGYIFNDAELIKKEINPTLRLTKKELESYEDNKYKILLVRFFIFISVLFFVYLSNGLLALSLLLCGFLILLTYYFYNNIRSRLSIVIYSLLVYLRYFGIFIIICNPTLLFYLWLVYPLCVTLEFMGKPKYKLNPFYLIKGYDFFRCVYYFIFIVVLLILYPLNINVPESINYLVCYFFIYRALSYILLSKKYRNS